MDNSLEYTSVHLSAGISLVGPSPIDRVPQRRVITMRHVLAVGLGIALAGTILTGSVQAQIKFADFDPAGDSTLKAQGIAFQEAKGGADLQHGTLVSVKLKDGSKVTGHVVRLDPKNKRLYVRTQAGEAPMAYAENDIKKIDKATREVDATDSIVRASFGSSEWRDLPGSNGLQENDNGVVRIRPKKASTAIKPAALEGKGDNKIKPLIEETNYRVQNVVEAEIIKQVSYNGTQRSVVYISSVVSPGEREILDQLQKAENDLMALANLKEQRETAIAQEMSMQEERIRNQKLINQTMQNENYSNYPYPYLPGGVTAPLQGALMPYLGFSTNRLPNKGVVTQLPQVLPPAAGLLERLPNVDPQTYAKARDEYAQLLRNHAFFENGRLIAVAAK
jgi:hypothetical protein